MGNTLIQDSRTGNIMGLTDNFIPVGIREYGGILYIASYNKETKEGELGTIPSPLIKYDYNNPILKNPVKDLADTGSSEEDINEHIEQNVVQVLSDDNFLHVGDQFMIVLDIDDISRTMTRQDAFFTNGTAPDEKTYPLFTHFDNEGNIVYGFYRIDLYSRVSSGKDIKLGSICGTQQQYYTEQDPARQESKYWFIDSASLTGKDLDTQRNSLAKLYRVYPNIPSGYLAIKIELEIPEDIDILPRTDRNFVNLPYTYVVQDGHTTITRRVSKSDLLHPDPSIGTVTAPTIIPSGSIDFGTTLIK